MNCGSTPLHRAVRAGCSECVQLLLDKRADKGLLDERGSPASSYAPRAAPYRRTLYASKHQHLMDDLLGSAGLDLLTKTSVAGNLDLSVGGELGWTPFMQMVLFCNRRAMQFLLDRHVRPYGMADSGLTAMLYGFWIDSETLLMTLTGAGSQPPRAVPGDGRDG